MNARELQDLLRDLLEEAMFARHGGDLDDPFVHMGKRTVGIRSLCTYDDVGMLTRDKGLVVECDDGGEFQITITDVGDDHDDQEENEA